MEVIELDDTTDGSLFVLDETPILDNLNKKNANKRKRKPAQKKPNSYLVLGGTIQDESPNATPKPKRKKKKRKSVVETIVIEDDNDSGHEASVIELSDDEKVGVIGGLLSGSMERIQRRIGDYQKQRQRNANTNKENEKNQNKHPVKEISPYFCPKTPGNSHQQPSIPRKLRPIVIDGSNVAFGHGNRLVFSSKGIEICYEYFKKRGHAVKVFIPLFRRRHPATTDHHILDRLEAERIVIYTPSRRIEGKTVSSYDDRMMVDYAVQSGGVIVTRDNLRDIAAEKETYKEVIYKRLLMFTWVDEEIILFPQDPLGRRGPTLDEFLSFPPEESDDKKEDKAEVKEDKTVEKEENTVKNDCKTNK